jgi:hypothetical protein
MRWGFSETRLSKAAFLHDDGVVICQKRRQKVELEEVPARKAGIDGRLVLKKQKTLNLMSVKELSGQSPQKVMMLLNLN